MLGTSETVGDFTDLFTLCDKKNKIYAKKLIATRLNIDLADSSYPSVTTPPQVSVIEQLPSDMELQREADRIVLNYYAPAGVVVDMNLEILQFRGQTSPYLEPAPGRATLNLLRMAKEELRRELQTGIYQARQQKLSIKREGIQVREGDATGSPLRERIRQITINIIPFQIGETQECYVSNDLQNLLNSINIPILMLGADLQIRQFTPAVEGIFNLISTDIGRPLSDITHKLNVPNLEQEILEVIRTLNLKAAEIQDRDGHWYHLRIRPYRTIDNKIDGAVLVLIDIDNLKRSNAQLMEARDYADAIVETVWQPLIVLNQDLRVIAASRSFYDAFQVAPVEIEQHLIFELGNGQWNIPQLRSQLEEILASNTQFQNFQVEHQFEQIGHKVMRLKARKLPRINNIQMILLAIEDITESHRLETEPS
ncbi:PAS domain-containing protein [Microcoleus sp. FACHB-SPT15]|uniref:PAS domain-containing protein n=1 Tax=Microcoleus sp. FACHB-SPT15 TaxID=2692830 RepID=UPI001781F8DA|nr:PAS domain-containing protein [Microcoleus sp. FACHB-SPT15]MBD1809684.1 PAS domain-containing protein [Microcoleus sp. FACHB-SPT15]